MTMIKIEPTQENLNRIFEYRDGELYWKEKPSPQSRAVVGESASKFYTDCYGEAILSVNLGTRTYSVSRIIYTMFHGYIPEIVVHIDRNKLNNKIENLKSTTRRLAASEQVTKNESGYRNVYVNPNCKLRFAKPWIAKTKINGKSKTVGTFDNPHEAYLAVLKMEEEYREEE